MYILLVSLCFLLRLIVAQNDTLQDVTLEWKFSTDGDPIKRHVASSNHLIEHLPRLDLKVTGTVPTLNAGVFLNLQDLSSLVISEIGLEEIQAETFKNLPRLEHIECNNNSMSGIRSGIFVNLNVTVLRLESDRIKSLEIGAFQNLPRLEQLILKNNQLEEIGAGVFDNISPYHLNLSDNTISKLDKGVFEKIYPHRYDPLRVTLNRNKMREIDPEVFSHGEINTLELGENEISQLRPGDLKNLPKLQTLILSNNQIETISDNTFPATLENIDLGDNQIAHISSRAFDGIHLLKRVTLSHNQLTEWNPDWFPGLLRDHTNLYASYNHIEEIPDDAFRNNSAISRLDLGKNRIKRIAPGAFRSLRHMRGLWLNDNEIADWDGGSFGIGNSTFIFEMNLRRNRFRCFQGDLMEVFKHVHFVRIEQNPIRKGRCLEKVEKYQKEIKYKLDKFYDGSW